jgi:hypothetical protein
MPSGRACSKEIVNAARKRISKSWDSKKTTIKIESVTFDFYDNQKIAVLGWVSEYRARMSATPAYSPAIIQEHKSQ